MRLEAVEDAVKTAVKKTNRDATRRLRYKAALSGWPQKAVSGMSVDLHSDDPLPLTPEMEDLEYGTTGTAPSPVVRTSDTELTNLFVRNVRKELRKCGVVI